MEALGEAVRRRNEWRGHDAAITPAERDARITSMAVLIRAFRTSLDGALDNWELWRPQGVTESAGRSVVDAQILDRPNARLRVRSVEIDHHVESGALYLQAPDSRRALPLVPLMRAERSETSIESAVYFFDRIDGAETRWLSYDAAARPDLREPTPSWLTELLADLDDEGTAAPSLEPARDPAAGSGRAVPARPVVAPAAPIGESAVMRGLVEAVADWLPDVTTTESGGRVDLVADRRLGRAFHRQGAVHLVARVPIEHLAVVPGTTVTEIPVTEDDEPGVELLVEERSDLKAALALLLQASMPDGTAGQAPEIARVIAPVVGETWRPTFGDGLWPRSDWSRARQAVLWDAIMSGLAERPTDSATSIAQWPGMLRISQPDGITVSIRLSSVATTIGVELPEGLPLKRVTRILTSLRTPDRQQFAVQHRMGTIIALGTVASPDTNELTAAIGWIEGAIRSGWAERTT